MGIVAHSGMMTGMNTHCTVFGIPNCDTVKKARAWLVAQGIEHQFHDFKKQGVPQERLDRWMHALGWQPLLNTRGPTWRKIAEEERATVSDSASARVLMVKYPSVIKRPVVEWPGARVTVGFDAARWLA
jgi:Spx/MgsR family transcriptional regulator